jgi:NAD(P)-dependent dehydrogenase (short-subunit alcohol dehydrogenase family)
MTSLVDSVAIVTGAATGIGFAIAEHLVCQGARVVIADSGVSIDGQNPDPSAAREAAEKLGRGSVGFSEHLNSPQAAGRLIKQTRNQFGKIDILVNNAAILRDGFIFKTNPEDWDEVLTNNLSTYFYLLNAATPVLREQAKKDPTYSGGRIVNMTSTAGFYGNFGQSAYASTKAGIFGLTRCVAHDMARSRTTCNAIAPFASTRVTDTIEPANDSQTQYKNRALKISAAFVAQFVCYLCLERAKAVTGQLFTVRGKEVFLFSQPRPTARTIQDISEHGLDNLADAVEQDLQPHFLALETDLEAFNTEPLV